METAQVCPQCGYPVDHVQRDCSSCGINLALAAGYAASALKVELPLPSTPPIAPEIFVPRLGEILVERGILTPDQLQQALNKHKEIIAAGKTKLFGQLLLELGLIDRPMLDQVVTEQILKLQQALQHSNQVLEQRVRERTQDLQNALKKLSDLNELKTNFVSNISHELRTPLTHIKGYLSLLIDQSLGPLTDEQQGALDVVWRAETRLEQLIEDLIQFSLVSKGEMILNYSQVDVAAVVSLAVTKAESFSRARSVSVNVHLDENLPPVHADSDKITWVLMQLLDNAIKFSSPAGRVDISAQHEDGFVCIRVQDNGIGIPDDKIPEIFEPFHQLDGSTTRHFGGFGLGLALVKRIIDAHGVTLTVDSRVGQGSCFEFSLPVSQGEKTT